MERWFREATFTLLLASILSTLIVLSNLELVQATKYSLCDKDKTDSEVSNLIISQCETLQDTCPFVRGTNKTIELDFTPKKKAEQVKVKVAGKISHLPVPFHIKPDNACGNYGFDCPLEPNKPYKFKLSLPILKTYPKRNVDILLRLLDESDHEIVCVEIPARIQDPQTDSAT